MKQQIEVSQDILVAMAATTYRARQAKVIPPQGNFLSGQWKPSPREQRECCQGVTNGIMDHCRDIEHIANLFRVPQAALERELRFPTTSTGRYISDLTDQELEEELAWCQMCNTPAYARAPYEDELARRKSPDRNVTSTDHPSSRVIAYTTDENVRLVRIQVNSRPQWVIQEWDHRTGGALTLAYWRATRSFPTRKSALHDLRGYKKPVTVL